MWKGSVVLLGALYGFDVVGSGVFRIGTVVLMLVMVIFGEKLNDPSGVNAARLRSIETEPC
jgi:hypothetical protein